MYRFFHFCLVNTYLCDVVGLNHLIGMFAQGFFANSHILLALILALVLGTIDQLFVKSKLKPRGKATDL